MTNLVVLQGNLTRDPEVREITANGRPTKVANFTIAVNRHFKRADGTKDKETTYVDCEAWDTGANTLGEYVHKGDPIIIEGSLKLDSWENKEGEKRSKLKVRVARFNRLYRAPPQADGAYANQNDNGSANVSAPAEAKVDTPEVMADAQPGDGDIPF